MPFYFFNLSFGERIILDEEGVELPNRAAAREEALAVVRDLSNREVGRRWASWFLDITDEQGSFLRLPIGYPALEVMPKDGHRPQPNAAELEPAYQSEPSGSLAEGGSKETLPTPVAQVLAIRKQTDELVARSNRVRDELSSGTSVKRANPPAHASPGVVRTSREAGG
jgi:hypothetical protein